MPLSLVNSAFPVPLPCKFNGFRDVIKFLDESLPGKLEQLALSNYCFHTKTQRHPHISYQPDKMRAPLEIRGGMFIEGNLSSSSVMHFIGRLMDEYHVDKSSFYISVATEEQDAEEDSVNASDE